MKRRKAIDSSETNDFGSLVWQETAIFQLAYPFTSVKGRSRREKKVYYKRGKLCIRREWVVPFNPATPLQEERRTDFGPPHQQWSSLSEKQRQAWREYGQRHLWPGEKWQSPGLVGPNAFASVHTYRLPLGLGYLAEAPKEGPPPAALSISQEPAPGAHSFAFRVEHELAEPRGYLLVKLTAAMPSVKRKPRKPEFVWATGEAQGTFLPLQPSGAVYTIPQARFPVENGQRYGIMVALVSADGVDGPTLKGNFIKIVHA